MHYRRLNQLDGAFRGTDMTPCPDGYAATIPADAITDEWDMLVYFSANDDRGDPMLHPGIDHPTHDAPYFLIKVR